MHSATKTTTAPNKNGPHNAAIQVDESTLRGRVDKGDMDWGGYASQ